MGWGTRTSEGWGPLWGHKNGLHMGDRLAGVHGGSCVSDLSTGGEGCRLRNRSPQSGEKGLAWGCPSLVAAGPRPAVQVRLSSRLDETVAEGQDKGREREHEEGGARGRGGASLDGPEGKTWRGGRRSGEARGASVALRAA